MTARATRRLAVALLATLGACTEADPRELRAPDGLGAAGSPVTQPKFEPYVPPPGTAATSGGDAVAGSSGPATGGTGGASTGRAGDMGSFVLIPELEPIAMDVGGSVVAGNRQVLGLDRAFVWSAATRGAVPLPLARDEENAATGMSTDGVFIVGAEYTHHREVIQAVRWVRGERNVVQRLGFATPTHDRSWASGVGADGSAVACTSHRSMPLPGESNGLRAFRWKDGVVRVIEPLPNDTGTEAVLISASGSTIAGYSFGEDRRTQQRLFVWSDDTGNTTEVVIPGAATRLVPRYFSADGSMLVGEAITGTPDYQYVLDIISRTPFRWSRQGAVFIPAVDTRSETRVDGASADGTVVLATSFDSVGGMDFQPIPFVSMPSVSSQVLPVFGPADISSVGLDPSGKVVAGLAPVPGGQRGVIFWRISSANDISMSAPFPSPLPTIESKIIAITPGGRTLLGKGKGPDGGLRAWIMATGLGPPPN